MNLKEKRAAALSAAQEIINGAKTAARDLTAEEKSTVEAKFSEVEGFDTQIKAAADSDALMKRLGSYGDVAGDKGRGDDAPAKSLGEHFVKHVGAEGLARVKSQSGATISAPEFKAPGDTHASGAVYAPALTEFDTSVVREYRRPTVADVLGTGSLSGNAVTYLVEGGVEGGFATVAEGGAKPQFHIGDPTTRTDALKKIAGFLKHTDEMAEDLPFVISEINNRGLYLLSLAEENQLLNGTGTGSNVLGLLNREGIQTEASTGAGDNADSVFRATTKIQTATGLTADAVLINPADYQALRLSKDANEQYFGGGFFQGQYGNGGILSQPPLWGLNTIVTAAVAPGSAVVGAFKTATTVYRKGGVRVESTNSHADDFTNNLVTTRIEERVALACRIPAAIVKVTFSAL